MFILSVTSTLKIASEWHFVIAVDFECAEPFTCFIHALSY